MINLRYHIVSLTAVFLAIGIGLTFGSTFLDRATVDNLNGQLDSLETRLSDREDRINELEDTLRQGNDLQAALDDEAVGLLAGRLDSVPVVVLSERGVDEKDVDAAVQALVVAGADVQGRWWFTDRWVLDDDAEVEDLATILGQESNDPSRLRRAAIDQLGASLRSRQLAVPPFDENAPLDGGGDSAPADTTPEGTDSSTTTTSSTTVIEAPTTEAPTDGTTGDTVPAEPDEVPIVTALVENGFIQFEAPAGGPDAPRLPAGTRFVLVGGSPDVPDDLVLEPLVSRLARAGQTPIAAVASSALPGEGKVSDLVSYIRQDDRLRELVPTVDRLEHFEGWAATVLSLSDVGDGVVGHYGVGDDSTRLLPALQAP